MSRLQRITTEVQSALASLSGYEQSTLSVESSFLELGMDSLMLTQLAKVVASEYQVAVTLSELMNQHSSISELAAHIDTESTEDSSTAATTTSEQTAEPHASAPAPSPSPPAVDTNLEQALQQIAHLTDRVKQLESQLAVQADAEEITPLSESLAELWVASHLSPEATLCFNLVSGLSFRGHLDLTALADSIGFVLSRHEIFGARFLAEGKGFQISRDLPLDIEQVDLSLLSGPAQKDALDQLAIRIQETPMDLEQGPLYSFHLAKLSETSHMLFFNAHHTICDGWTIRLVFSELSRAYDESLSGTRSDWGPAATYRNYVKQISQIPNQRCIDYWLDLFATPVPPLQLPTDWSGESDSSYRAAAVRRTLDTATVQQVKKMAARSGSTPFAVCMASLQLLLYRISRTDRVMVAFPSTGQSTHEATQTMAGHRVRFLPLIADIQPELPFCDLLSITQTNLLQALAHDDLTYGELIQHLPADERPTIQAVINFENLDNYLDGFGELEAEVVELDQRFSNHPLILNVAEHAGEIELRFTYQTSLFSEDTVANWLETYTAILDRAVAQPGLPNNKLAACISADQWKWIESLNNTATAYPSEQSVGARLDEVAFSQPDSIALTWDDSEWTYQELREHSTKLGAILQEAGVTKGDRVGLFLDRSPLLMTAIFGVLKCGAAYVPLDINYPAERIALITEDSSIDTILTTSELEDQLPDRAQHSIALDLIDFSEESTPQFSPPAIESSDAAYIIYTSGSTGKPKGTEVPHRGIQRLVLNNNYCQLDSSVVILQAASIGFDASTFEVFGALLNGGRLVLPTQRDLTIQSISECLQREKINTLWLTAGLFQVLVDESLDSLTGIRQLLTGGDVVPMDHARRVMNAHPGLQLINGYGPTENTTFTTCHAISEADLDLVSLPIGKPIANTTTWILDKKNRPLPPGIPGELCTGGDGVAIGYLNRPVLTAQKFIDDPFSNAEGAKLYRTGDLCRYRSDGTIEFLGRIDKQVKIRGFRIEPGEIESKIAAITGVGHCKVVPHGETAEEKVLVGYVSPRDEGYTLTPSEITGTLRTQLPDYMVPASIVVLEEMPLNCNGKIDTASLPAPGYTATAASPTKKVAHTPPNSDTELQIANWWKEVLSLEQVGIHDNFFDVGGHSLMGMRIFSKIQKHYRINLPMATLFVAPTIATLAVEVEKLTNTSDAGQSDTTAATDAIASATKQSRIGDTSNGVLVPIQPAGKGKPLFAVHGGDGGILFYNTFATSLGRSRPVYAIEAPGLSDDGPIPKNSVEEAAAKYIKLIRKVQAEGPYYLCGYSFGGVIAYEMARQLTADGQEVAFVGVIDIENPSVELESFSPWQRVLFNWQQNAANTPATQRVWKIVKRLFQGIANKAKYKVETAVHHHSPPGACSSKRRMGQLNTINSEALHAYRPMPWKGKVTLFRAKEQPDHSQLPADYGWESVATHGVEAYDVDGRHLSIFDPENVSSVTAAMRVALAKVNRTIGTKGSKHHASVKTKTEDSQGAKPSNSKYETA